MSISLGPSQPFWGRVDVNPEPYRRIEHEPPSRGYQAARLAGHALWYGAKGAYHLGRAAYHGGRLAANGVYHTGAAAHRAYRWYNAPAWVNDDWTLVD